MNKKTPKVLSSGLRLSNFRIIIISLCLYVSLIPQKTFFFFFCPSALEIEDLEDVKMKFIQLRCKWNFVTNFDMTFTFR